MSVYVYLAGYIVAVSVVVAALFLPGRRLRIVAAGLGALALWMPFTIFKASLGTPHPFAPTGQYELLGVRWNPGATRVFVLVNDDLRSPVPRLYSMPWEKRRSRYDDTFDFDEAPHGYVGQTVQLGPGGMIDLSEMPYQPPDLDKDKWYAENRPAAPLNQRSPSR